MKIERYDSEANREYVYDENEWVYLAAENGAGTYTVNCFPSGGTVRVLARALVNGWWTYTGEANVSVKPAPKLTAPTVQAYSEIRAGSALMVEFTSVPNAEGLVLFIEDSNGTVVYNVLAEESPLVIPEETFERGQYSIHLVAFAQGWLDSEPASLQLNVTGERSAAPEISANGTSLSIHDVIRFTATGDLNAEQICFEFAYMDDEEWIQDEPFIKDAENGQATYTLMWLENSQCNAVRARAKAKVDGFWSRYSEWTVIQIIQDSTWTGDDLILPSDLIEIGEEAFSGVHARRVTIPDHVTRIGNRAFADSMMLASVYIPNSVTYIAENAFTGCYGGFTLIADEGNAYVEQYARDHGFRFEIKE